MVIATRGNRDGESVRSLNIFEESMLDVTCDACWVPTSGLASPT
jgi:hypothetical protein